MRVIKVYGSLAKFLGQRSFRAAVSSPIEAIRFLLANFPQAETHIAQHDYKISVGRNPLQIGDQPELLTYPTAESEPIRIIPVMQGAGSSGGQIAAGIGLIALSFLLPGAGLFGTTSVFGVTAAQGGAILAGLGTAFSTIGASLVLTGVAGLIAPTSSPNGLATTGSDSATDPRRSFSFSGIQNVSRQGVPVPIVYGEVVVGSVVISAGINTEEVAV
jgi:predicted phage tail protein